MATTLYRRLLGTLLLGLVSTVAFAADTVVPLSVIPDISQTGTLGALNAAGTLTTVHGCSSVGMQLDAGTLVGTIVPEVSLDSGTSWTTTFFDDPSTSNKATTIVYGSSNTATSRTLVGAGGGSSFRVRVSVYTSGTATVHLRCSAISDPSELYSGAPSSTTQPPTVAQVGGWSGTTLTPFKTNTGGILGTYTNNDVTVIQSNATVTTSGSTTVSGITNRTARLIFNIKNNPTGTTPTLTYELDEIDPGDLTTVINSISSFAVSSINNGYFSLPLQAGVVKVKWTVTGTTPSFTGVYATLVTNQITDSTLVNQGSPDTVDQSWPVRISDLVHTMPTMDAAARKGFHAITDGTNTSAVKAASTAPVAADPALVVAVSPNSAGLTDTTTASTALGALNATVQVALAGQQGAGFTLAAGTLAATLVPEVSYDGGTTWTFTYLLDPSIGQIVSSPSFTNPNAAKQYSIFATPGASHVRVRVLLYTSGTANATLRASQAAPTASLMAVRDVGGGVINGARGSSLGDLFVVGPVANGGGASSTNPVVVGGWDNTNAQRMLTDTTGQVFTVTKTSDTSTGDTGTKTSTFAGATQTNANWRGAAVTILLGTVSGTTPTLSAQLQFSPDAGTTWLNYGPALANLTATSQTGTILCYPSQLQQSLQNGGTPAGLATGATTTLGINAPLPRTWRINYTIAGTTPSFAVTSVRVNYLD